MNWERANSIADFFLRTAMLFTSIITLIFLALYYEQLILWFIAMAMMVAMVIKGIGSFESKKRVQ